MVSILPCHHFSRHNINLDSHLQAPKYRCPRCSTRTCSLPCSTRHKTRAECSGTRDPTVFIKKSQLETPSGFDHDYNFLSGLMGKVSRGDEHLENRDIEGQEGDPAPRRNGKFWDSVREIGLAISQAPVGMSRQRANRSRWGNRYVNSSLKAIPYLQTW